MRSRHCQDIYFCKNEARITFSLVVSAFVLFQICCSSLHEDYKQFLWAFSTVKLEQKSKQNRSL